MKSWQTKKLGEVCDIFNGNSVNAKVKKEKYFGLTAGYPFIATKDVNFDSSIDYENGVKIPNNETKFKISKKNSVLICAEGGSAGRKIGFTAKDVCFGNKLFSINSGKHNNKFIYYFCFTNYFQKEFKKSLTGIIGGVSLKKFKNIQILLPPLTEQKAIVKKLDEIFEKTVKAKENAEKNLQNAKDLFELYLENIFINPEDNWGEKSLGEIATFRNGMNFTKKSRGESIKIVGVKDFQKNFWIPSKNLELVTIDGKLNETDSLKENDILTVRSNGNPKLIGRCILSRKVTEKTSHSGFTIRIRLNSNKNYSQYLCHYLKSQTAKKQLIESGTGMSIKSLNQVTLASLVIPIPPLQTQKAIVKKLDALSEQTKKLEGIYKQKLVDLEELRKSVLKSAFAGKD
ncbi:restriction endonuclease subunit S [bacterium]|nr:MAG: restriction endonuclease subunit S [bacterium]